MMASTPTGRRGKFYKACVEERTNMEMKPVKTKDGFHFDMREYDRMEAKGWKEFHFPTMVNPEWSEAMESELRGMYTQEGYEHEVMAEFGTEMKGVFNKDFIDEAGSTGYGYHSHRTNDAPIAIGVDWDKAGAATQIVVTQWDPIDERRADGNENQDIGGYGRFRVINRIEIPKGEFTYDNAVKKIQELDRIYEPFAIYVDKGAGDYQSEVLRKTIGDKVRAVAFGSVELVRDPVSRQFDRKPLKAFMVNMTTLLLERGQLRIPDKDTDETFIRQMTNYTMVRIAPKTGEPTFSSTDEHALDGLMLTLYAFNTEFPELAQAIYKTRPASQPKAVNTVYVDPLADMSQQGFGEKKTQSWDEPGAPPPKRVRVGSRKRRGEREDWGGRGSGGTSFGGRNHF